MKGEYEAGRYLVCLCGSLLNFRRTSIADWTERKSMELKPRKVRSASNLRRNTLRGRVKGRQISSIQIFNVQYKRCDIFTAASCRQTCLLQDWSDDGAPWRARSRCHVASWGVESGSQKFDVLLCVCVWMPATRAKKKAKFSNLAKNETKGKR